MLLLLELTTQPLVEMVSTFIIYINAAVPGADNAAPGGDGKSLYNCCRYTGYCLFLICFWQLVKFKT